MMSDVSHLTYDPVEGEETVAMCGHRFVVRVLDPGLPVCVICVDELGKSLRQMVDVADDLKDRLDEVMVALDLRDDLGQSNLLHHVTNTAISDALYRPGPSFFEGPVREDGTFRTDQEA